MKINKKEKPIQTEFIDFIYKIVYLQYAYLKYV